eukprot:TRINITY_DN6522_c0_g1_i3.p1 TRINITY_DN6522_c0_g1~~TRINITY_DN6522_c0_g1_i3.p1  ORF type:complete len:855 (+),score=166.40 TRINITY_DN6522_c0_g1_i3:58-2622(+)
MEYHAYRLSEPWCEDAVPAAAGPSAAELRAPEFSSTALEPGALEHSAAPHDAAVASSWTEAPLIDWAAYRETADNSSADVGSHSCALPEGENSRCSMASPPCASGTSRCQDDASAPLPTAADDASSAQNRRLLASKASAAIGAWAKQLRKPAELTGRCRFALELVALAKRYSAAASQSEAWRSDTDGFQQSPALRSGMLLARATYLLVQSAAAAAGRPSRARAVSHSFSARLADGELRYFGAGCAAALEAACKWALSLRGQAWSLDEVPRLKVPPLPESIAGEMDKRLFTAGRIIALRLASKRSPTAGAAGTPGTLQQCTSSAVAAVLSERLQNWGSQDSSQKTTCSQPTPLSGKRKNEARQPEGRMPAKATASHLELRRKRGRTAAAVAGCGERGRPPRRTSDRITNAESVKAAGNNGPTAAVRRSSRQQPAEDTTDVVYNRKKRGCHQPPAQLHKRRQQKNGRGDSQAATSKLLGVLRGRPLQQHAAGTLNHDHHTPTAAVEPKKRKVQQAPRTSHQHTPFVVDVSASTVRKQGQDDTAAAARREGEASVRTAAAGQLKTRPLEVDADVQWLLLGGRLTSAFLAPMDAKSTADDNCVLSGLLQAISSAGPQSQSSAATASAKDDGDEELPLMQLQPKHMQPPPVDQHMTAKPRSVEAVADAAECCSLTSLLPPRGPQRLPAKIIQLEGECGQKSSSLPKISEDRAGGGKTEAIPFATGERNTVTSSLATPKVLGAGLLDDDEGDLIDDDHEDTGCCSMKTTADDTRSVTRAMKKSSPGARAEAAAATTVPVVRSGLLDDDAGDIIDDDHEHLFNDSRVQPTASKVRRLSLRYDDADSDDEPLAGLVAQSSTP